MIPSDFLQYGTLVSIDDDRLLIGWGPRQWIHKPLSSNTPSFYFPDFFLRNPTPWFHHSHWAEMRIDELAAALGSPPHTSSPDWKIPDKHSFLSIFEDLQTRFASKKLRKGVPFAFSSSPSPLTPDLLHRCLIHLLHYVKQTPLKPYGFWDATEGMLGATPELLCSLDNHTLYTVALAGTYPKTSSPDDLTANPKEQHEHRLVVEGIKQSLAPFGQVTVSQQSVLALPTLYHLMTPIAMTLAGNIPLEEIIKVLHPTPALGAFPRQAGMRWLEDIQSTIDRRRFGAPAGVVYNQGQQAHCWVAIRNVQWDRHGMAIGAGCGVVPESLPEKEWNEVLLKIAATKRALGLDLDGQDRE